MIFFSSIVYLPYMWKLKISWTIWHIIFSYVSVILLYFVGIEKLYTKFDNILLYVSIICATISCFYVVSIGYDFIKYQLQARARFEIDKIDDKGDEEIKKSFDKIKYSISEASNSIAEESKMMTGLVEELTIFIESKSSEIAKLKKEYNEILKDVKHLKTIASLSEGQIQSFLVEIEGRRRAGYLITGIITYVLGLLSTGTFYFFKKIRHKKSETEHFYKV